ncbi:Phenylcoumaran benzylic ether reductase tp7 [Ancistrocladus abbreviatus]
MFAEKARIRRTIEAEGIPYTYISCYGFAGFFLSNLGQKNATAPPRDKVVIPGDGNNKGIFVVEEDIATYTIKAVDDPRTLNKTLHIRPPANILSFGEIVALWEEKIGKALEKNYVPEDEILKRIRDSPSLPSFILSIEHFVFVIGGGAMATIDQSSGVDACELYPEVKYTTVGDYLGQFA